MSREKRERSEEETEKKSLSKAEKEGLPLNASEHRLKQDGHKEEEEET